MNAEVEKLLERAARTVNEIADRQVRHEEHFARIDKALARTADLLVRHGELLVSHEESVARLDVRMDEFREAMLRGFTDAAGRDSTIDGRVDEIETRVTAIEHQE